MHFPLIVGGAGWLRMRDGGVSQFDVRATGILEVVFRDATRPRAGLECAGLVRLAARSSESADVLRDKINEWFGKDAPVHLVGHSMGGMVSRTFILKHKDRWERAWDAKGNARRRAAHHARDARGSFSIPQICTGTEASVRKLVIADIKHSASEIVGIVNTFPGNFQMLPSTAVMPTMEPLYHAETYGSFPVAQALLDNARSHHEKLAPIVDRDRMIYVAGSNRRTYDDIRDMSGLQSIDAYSTSMKGDGTVPHRLGFLEQDGKRIPTYFADAGHGDLPNNASVIAATLQLMETGKCKPP
jgi:pimeloyl-ACP methyl ester carboxylesterase